MTAQEECVSAVGIIGALNGLSGIYIYICIDRGILVFGFRDLGFSV